jgi:thymidine kinase
MNRGFELIVGPMFSGKTEELIRRITRAKLAKHKAIVYKPEIDTRYSRDSIKCHNGLELCCNFLVNPDELKVFLDREPCVIGIDEIQFFDCSIVKTLQDLVAKGFRVNASGS